MPKWNRRRFAPDRYPRDGFYSSDGICRALRYHASSASDLHPACLPLLLPLVPCLPRSKTHFYFFFFSFSLFIEKRIESQCYKRSSRYGIIFRTENSRFKINIYHRLFLLRNQIISFLQCREFQIYREFLFVFSSIFEFFIERIRRHERLILNEKEENKFFKVTFFFRKNIYIYSFTNVFKNLFFV